MFLGVLMRRILLIVLLFVVGWSNPVKGQNRQHTLRITNIHKITTSFNGRGRANGSSWFPSISGNGRFVVFKSWATNLVAEGPRPGAERLVQYDRQTGSTVYIEDSPSYVNWGYVPTTPPYISNDGEIIAFESKFDRDIGRELVRGSGIDVFIHNRSTETTKGLRYLITESDPDIATRPGVQWALSPPGGQDAIFNVAPALSQDGRIVVFGVPLDLFGRFDIFALNLQNKEITNVSRGEIVWNPVAYFDPFGRSSLKFSISVDGRFIAFGSYSDGLVAGDANGGGDVFVREVGGAIERVSVATDGTEGNSASFEPFISGNGRFVAFSSLATNLTPDDPNPNDGLNIFIHDRQTRETSRIPADFTPEHIRANSISAVGTLNPTISDDGRFVAFERHWIRENPQGSYFNDWYTEVLVFDRQTGELEPVGRKIRCNRPDEKKCRRRPFISGNGKYIVYEEVDTTRDGHYDIRRLVRPETNIYIAKINALPPPPPPPLPCADSDGGKDPFVAGAVKRPNLLDLIDNCCQGRYLQEYFCDEGESHYRWFQCGCENYQCRRGENAVPINNEEELPAECRVPTQQ